MKTKGQALIPLLIVIIIALSLGVAAIEIAIGNLLVNRYSYEELTIQDGQAASRTFLNLVQSDAVSDEAEIRTDLLAYCELDTLAMVKLINCLYSAVD